MKRYLTKSESILEFLPINLLIQMYWVIENQQKGMKPATDLSCIWLHILFIIKSAYINNVRIDHATGHHIFMPVNRLLTQSPIPCLYRKYKRSIFGYEILNIQHFKYKDGILTRFRQLLTLSKKIWRILHLIFFCYDIKHTKYTIFELELIFVLRKRYPIIAFTGKNFHLAKYNRETYVKSEFAS